MKMTFYITFLATLLMSCSSKKVVTEVEEIPCVVNTNESCVCITLYKPVCGCDNKTYTNSCHAKCNGVTYVEGECK
jgi:hypothetical protein